MYKNRKVIYVNQLVACDDDTSNEKVWSTSLMVEDATSDRKFVSLAITRATFSWPPLRLEAFVD